MIGVRYRARAGTETGFFDGDIDEIRIYDRALDAETIRTLVPGKLTDLRSLDLLLRAYGDPSERVRVAAVEALAAREGERATSMLIAAAAGGNAVVGVDLDYEVINSMMMVSASGTAVGTPPAPPNAPTSRPPSKATGWPQL